MKVENIKYKAKRLDNGEWVEGSLIRSNAGIKERAYIVDSFSSMSDYSVIGVDPSTVCQFTGLKDRNGVEVYENDIVKAVDFEENICNIEYKDYGFCLCGECFRDDTMPLFVAIGNCDIYVVGNKFDKEK